MFKPVVHEAIARFLLAKTCAELERLASEKDIPLHAVPDIG
jgi:alpha-methylacyl-CoA racemase